jgi:hypothetical protein
MIDSERSTNPKAIFYPLENLQETRCTEEVTTGEAVDKRYKSMQHAVSEFELQH